MGMGMEVTGTVEDTDRADGDGVGMRTAVTGTE